MALGGPFALIISQAPCVKFEVIWRLSYDTIWYQCIMYIRLPGRFLKLQRLSQLCLDLFGRSCWNQLPLPVGADRALGWHCHHASCRWDNMGQQKTVPAPWCSQFIPNVDVTLQGVFTALPVFFGWFCYQWYYATWKPLESFESFSRGRYSCTVIWGTLLVLVPPWCCDDSLWSVLRMLLLQSRLQVSSGSMGLANHAS